jgi:hypothetical protein
MAFHADRREARSQQPPGEGSEFNASRKSGPMRQDGGLTGDGTAPAVDDVPALERIHATLPAALWARSCLPARGADRAGDHLDRGPAAHRPAPQLGEDPLNQEGAPVQVPITVKPPAGRFTACVART